MHNISIYIMTGCARSPQIILPLLRNVIRFFLTCPASKSNFYFESIVPRIPSKEGIQGLGDSGPEMLVSDQRLKPHITYISSKWRKT